MSRRAREGSYVRDLVLNAAFVHLRGPHHLEEISRLSANVTSQFFINGPNLTSGSHSIGATQLLKCRGFSGPQNEFEQKLLLTLRALVVRLRSLHLTTYQSLTLMQLFESLRNSNITFTNEEWHTMVLDGLDTGTVDADMMLCLGELPTLMDRAHALIENPNASSFEHYAVIAATDRIHAKSTSIIHRLRERWQETERETLLAQPDSESSTMFHRSHFNTQDSKRFQRCQHTRSLACALTTGILINFIRANLDEDETALRIESGQMAEEILMLADIAESYRPLGSLTMSLFLGAAWAGASSEELKERLVERANIFNEDMYEAGAVPDEFGMLWCLKNFFRRDTVSHWKDPTGPAMYYSGVTLSDYNNSKRESRAWGCDASRDISEISFFG